LCVASIGGPLLGAVGRLAGLVDTSLSVPLSGPLASPGPGRWHWAGIRAPRMRRQLSAYSGCCQFGTPKRPRKSDLAGGGRASGGACGGPSGVHFYISGVSGPSSSPENLRLGTIKSQKVTDLVRFVVVRGQTTCQWAQRHMAAIDFPNDLPSRYCAAAEADSVGPPGGMFKR
jgi:hypothetical protein